MAENNTKTPEEYIELFDILLSLETRDEMAMFFEDITTYKEMESLVQRLSVAKMLRSGITYAEISEKTGASTATISRVNRCLIRGSGGYSLAFSRSEEE